MTTLTLNIFVENLLQFSFKELGIAWQPEPRDRFTGIEYLFNETIGNAVKSISIKYKENVQKHSTFLWNFICGLSEATGYMELLFKLQEYSKSIYCSNLAIRDTYIFLAVIVDLAIRCASNNKHDILKDLVMIVPSVLNTRLEPDGFGYNYGAFLGYAHQLLNYG